MIPNRELFKWRIRRIQDWYQQNPTLHSRPPKLPLPTQPGTPYFTSFFLLILNLNHYSHPQRRSHHLPILTTFSLSSHTATRDIFHIGHSNGFWSSTSTAGSNCGGSSRITGYFIRDEFCGGATVGFDVGCMDFDWWAGVAESIEGNRLVWSCGWRFWGMRLYLLVHIIAVWNCFRCRTCSWVFTRE